MEAPAPTVLHTARFNPLYRPYLVVTIGFTMIVSIIGIPLAPFWFCGVGQWWARHYYNLLQCQLSDRALRFRKGILVQVEKTIPLENIQDVTFVEGPVLRRFNLSTIKFETAGHSAGQAHDMQLTGIIDAQDFRNRILAARDALRAQRAGAAPEHAAHHGAGDVGIQAQEQLRILRAMSERLDEIAAVLKERR
jgi:putative membrane protein